MRPWRLLRQPEKFGKRISHSFSNEEENVMAVKYVFVTGGVVSGLGKGITAASLGRLLKARGYKVTMQKFDPYINVDPGTMNPIQHGEVFVTDDGTETDLDLGHYERFIDESLDKNSNVTTGKIYWSVLQKERHGDYGGGTVQVIPHITNEIKDRFYKPKSEDDNRIAIIEVGGTVGDIESQPFLEAIRQFQHEIGHENAVLIHVTLIPYLKASGEMKTKPTQQSVKELQGMGLWPDVLVCRSEYEISEEMKAKIALFCNVPVNHVLQNLDVEYLYEAPLAMEKEHLAQVVCESLQLPPIKGLMDNIDKEGGNVYSILGMINHINDFPEDLEGKKIAVIGGGAVGLDVVEFFAARKADISIVEMMDQIGRDLDPVTKNDMKCQMKTHGVHQLTQTALLEVKEHSFLVKGSDGSYELPFDYGFVCLGMRAKGQLYPQLLDAFADDDVEILNIGDSQRARRIIDGTMEGRNILYHLTQRGYLD